MDVGTGKIAFGIVDTDDAIEEVEHGQPVVIVYPDQQPGGMGTLFFPNTLSVMKDCHDPGRRTATRGLPLFRRTVEAQLAAGPECSEFHLIRMCTEKVRLETLRHDSSHENRLQPPPTNGTPRANFSATNSRATETFVLLSACRLASHWQANYAGVVKAPGECGAGLGRGREVAGRDAVSAALPTSSSSGSLTS